MRAQGLLIPRTCCSDFLLPSHLVELLGANGGLVEVGGSRAAEGHSDVGTGSCRLEALWSHEITSPGDQLEWVGLEKAKE